MIRSTSLVAVAFLLLSAMPCRAVQPGPTSAGDSSEGEVLQLIQSYYSAFSDRDWDRYQAHFWPGSTMTTVWQPPGEHGPRVVVTTIAEFIQQAPSGPGSREIFEERMLSADVEVKGSLAVVFARYRARFGDPGAVSEWEGTDLFSLLKHDGEWRIVSLSFQPDGE